jgi:HEAT repeat protein
MPARTYLFAIALLFATPLLLSAQQPEIMHATLSTQAAGPDFPAQVKLIQERNIAGWIGYEIPVAPDVRIGSEGGETRFLERTEWIDRGTYTDAPKGHDHLVLLFRLQGGNVSIVQVEDPDKVLDVGGLPFVWFAGVTPVASIHLLESVASKPGSEKLHDSVVFLISLHRSPATVPALAGLASAAQEKTIREKAAFWLANQRDPQALVALKRLDREATDADLREKLTFDLTLSHDPAAPGELIRMAHEDTSPQVRRQAQFWMATEGGKKVADDLRTQAATDPEVEVRKSAVFALSRLPADEAARQLIQVAGSSNDPEVRKQAVFWLGQSADPRALDYLTRLLQQ